MDRVYTAEATASGARTGEVRSSDGRFTAGLSRPAEMGGDGGPGTNPEQLFAAGYAACFHSAMRFALRDLGLTPQALAGSSVTAEVHFLRAAPGDFGLRSEEHTSELQSRQYLVCRLLLEKKKKIQ